ncbi:MAG: hypothetical protein Q9217_000078 [Psora testacea]
MPTKTPKSIKATPKSKATAPNQAPRLGNANAAPSNSLPQELQQAVLKTFKQAFNIDHNELRQKIQQVKQHLYKRDFAQAFATESFRQAYTLRWSPSRALAYLDILHALDPLHLRSRPEWRDDEDIARQPSTGVVVGGVLPASTDSHGLRKVVCVGGGGGAEMVALAAYWRYMESFEPSPNGQEAGKRRVRLDCTLVDIADWSVVTQELLSAVTVTSPGAQYALQRGGIAAQPLLGPRPEYYSGRFVLADVLGMSAEELSTTLQGAMLVTIMFTLNELYSVSIKATTTFLLSLTDVLAPGALLLVVDSPGSYSTVGIGSDKEKKYPMQWLLDHTLLESAAASASDDGERGKVSKWEKMEGWDSRWFRLKGFRYPIELEDMRYQLHLYRKL